MTLRAAATAVSVAFLLAACGGGAATSGPSKGATCQPAPESVLKGIAAQGEGIEKMKSGHVYKSPDYKNVWFVAATFSADGVDDQTGVWATSSLDGTGQVLSVDGTAQQFTTWPHSDKSSAEIPASDPAVKVVKGC